MLALGTFLQNRYRIVRQLGRGGMGVVYEAIDQRLSRTVALKETLAETEELRRAFEREARLLANLNHPSLPRVVDHFSESIGQYLVMDFIPGDDLKTLLEQRDRPFDTAKVLLWADELLDTLEYLHAHEPPIIHRDIKPANLKLTAKGRIILLDFGLAKGAAGQMTVVTLSQSILGFSPHYAPLEQIQGEKTNQRSDLYALAATLYNLLTRRVPPDALTRATAMLNDEADPLNSIIRVNPNVPSSVAAVLMQALTLKPAQRPSSAADMRAALRNAAHSILIPGKDAEMDETTRVKPSSSLRPAQKTDVPQHPSKKNRRPKSSPMMWFNGSFIVLAIIFVTLVFINYQLLQRGTQLTLKPKEAPPILLESSPATSFAAFYKAWKSKDIAALKNTISKNYLDELASVAKTHGITLDEVLKTFIRDDRSWLDEVPKTLNEKINGDTATLEVRNEKMSGSVPISFIKESGQWKLAVNKAIRPTSKTNDFLISMPTIKELHIRPHHWAILQPWLAQRSILRLATKDDFKDKLSEVLSEEGKEKNFHPYYIANDFNGDGKEDFAVALINDSKSSDKFSVAVFNGPFGNKVSSAPSYFKDGLDLTEEGFFFFAFRNPHEYLLAIGPYVRTDNFSYFDPHDKGYVLKNAADEMESEMEEGANKVLGEVDSKNQEAPSLPQHAPQPTPVASTSPKKKIIQWP